MNPRRVSAIVLRQIDLMRSSPTRVVPLVAWVAIDIVLWGFITRYLGSLSAHGPDFTLTLLGAVLLWDFFGRIMQGVTTAFFEDVWSRSFLNLFASPISVSEYVAGLVATSILTSLISLLAMLLLARFAFGLSLLAFGLPAAGFLAVLFLFGIALGIFASAVVLRLGPASEWLVWPIPALLSPFAAVFYPLHVLPQWMQAAAHVLPPAYVFEGLRALAAGRGVEPGTLLLAALLALLQIALALGFFVRVFRGAIRSGLLARYSAESVA
ncbi:ABC-2 type transporter [mine drainage metagenome]|uniref:ABC-2 type transporter n=1 Tax=mine drainage metagenome TaxID=410659 RepID=T0YJT1_9ZZZZ